MNNEQNLDYLIKKIILCYEINTPKTIEKLF
jgi:hypothetical protein